MKAILYATVFATAIYATAASAEVVFQGHMLIRSVTPGCQNFQAGWEGSSQYHPRISGNQNFAGISIVWNYSASGYGITGHDFTTAFQNVGTAGVFWGPTQWGGSQVRFISRSPATISAATRFVTITGQIKKPENDNGGAACIATFEAAYGRDPNN